MALLTPPEIVPEVLPCIVSLVAARPGMTAEPLFVESAEQITDGVQELLMKLDR